MVQEEVGVMFEQEVIVLQEEIDVMFDQEVDGVVLQEEVHVVRIQHHEHGKRPIEILKYKIFLSMSE